MESPKLSRKLIAELFKLEAKQNDYKPAESIARQLQEKVLVLVVGPACTGKTTVIERVASLDERFGIVGSFTTRDPRKDEGGKRFTYIPHTDEGLEKLFERIEKREIVQYIVHPELKHFYGTDIADYPKTYNVLDFISSSVSMVKKLPFKSSPVAGLVVEASQWREWFNQRFPVGNPARDMRLDEAITSLSWLLSQPEGAVKWIINEPGKADAAAQELIRVGLGESKGMAHGRKTAELCLETARSMR